MEFNGFNFDDEATRKKMKYVVIRGGDLDLNGAYSFTSHKELKNYLKGYNHRETQAIFKVKDVTNFYSRPNNN